MKNNYKVIGLMSGTSLDGLDIAFCEFTHDPEQGWHFDLQVCETVEYTKEWKQKLSSIERASALEYAQFNADLGTFFGREVRRFVDQHQLAVDFVSSHGHTIFHQPPLGLTTQIGSGASLAAHSGLPVVCDFRTIDVALGGQGAPLVPIGDRLLFAAYDFCLNIGGIANISCEWQGKRIAYDIAPANMVLNSLAGRAGKDFDAQGSMAKSGKKDDALFEKLNSLAFYHLPFPKSLGKEWVLAEVSPLLDQSALSLEDLLCTFTHHIAFQIARSVQQFPGTGKKLFITGGGAFNSFLMELINFYDAGIQIDVPETKIIQFKEALVFAFLGVLRWREEVNCLQSVTGAKKDNCGGAVYWHQELSALN